MLDHLRVVNLGVLEDAAIDPSPGFTVITGETGAGKTLLLGGLRLILGGQADAAAVGPFAEEARVDGLFISATDETGASRLIPAEGRSRAYLEGAIVSAATLRERLGILVEIVGQHDQLALTRPGHLLEMIDDALDAEGAAAREAYSHAWSRLQGALERQRQLGGDRLELARELDLARYQSGEIIAAGLEPGLDDELESNASRLRNVEEIGEHLSESLQLAEQMSESVGEMVARLRKVSGLDPGMAELSNEAEGLAASIADIASEARSSADGLASDPGRLSELEDRLTELGGLKRKYGKTIEEVLDYGTRTSARADELETLIGDADRIEGVVAEAGKAVEKAGSELRDHRASVAGRVAGEMVVHLADLGLGTAQVEIALLPVDSGPRGSDRVELRFSSDARIEPGPVASVASGGELSRLVLALRLATRVESSATLVFDEVDTGIGGATALSMGIKLAELAATAQVLCVTHLAQVAAHADTHYVVERAEGSGAANVRQVSDADRITEITRMLAGQPESEAGKTAAAELLAIASGK
jgi:DNA repair protein RecN (Recombination protein N)